MIPPKPEAPKSAPCRAYRVDRMEDVLRLLQDARKLLDDKSMDQSKRFVVEGLDQLVIKLRHSGVQ